MRHEQWQLLLAAAHGQLLPAPPVALIVDSPWIPGFAGISTMDYISVAEVWLKANLDIARAFPDTIFIPGFWVEPGMAAEPSGFGCRVTFADSQPPSIHALADDVSALESLAPADPRHDGLMPVVLSLYRYALPRIRAAGMEVKIVAARGPLALASHLLGLTSFLVGLKTEPQKTRRLLATTTRTVRDWLEAQAEVLPGVEGILVLDDVVGFLSRDDYLEFAHPCLKEIFSLPVPLKVFHNDSDSTASYEFLHEAGVDVFNFTHLQGIPAARSRVGDHVCLMGNVPPRDVLAGGTAEQTLAHARRCLEENAGHPSFILSAGGGVSAGTPAANILALGEAARGRQPARPA